VNLNIEKNEMVILGTEYAGEMKKGVFTLMHYLMPKRDQLSLHASANVGPKGDVTVFFGLSGTGKTTLSADAHRSLIGDDEHVWTDDGVFNIEGGCYAKADGLTREREPEIWDAIKFGTVLENVVVNPETDVVNYTDLSITANTRVSYPIDFIPNAVVPSIAGHPSNLLLLTADASGVLPPVSRLTPEQAQYLFISGYTSKTPGTEMGIVEPEATFSACFGAPFLVLHPALYATLLADRLKTHNAGAWLINTGWTGGSFGAGKRMSLTHTRAILDAIHDGSLAKAPTEEMPVFGLSIPTECHGVPSDILNPRTTWKDKGAYDEALAKLAAKFHANMENFADGTPKEVLAAGPKL
jgi:phosphoenolpyruvate carboxykinase (ATP)